LVSSSTNNNYVFEGKRDKLGEWMGASLIGECHSTQHKDTQHDETQHKNTNCDSEINRKNATFSITLC
jgi:hypothetical protein